MNVLKWILKAIATVIVLVILAIILFFAINSYTSPVREAARDFKRVVRSYKNDAVENMDDVYERIAALDKHYGSTTHSKMQGGDKLIVTPEHIETMFGEPNAVLKDVESGRGKVDVYQYQYGRATLNFHDDWEGIGEYIFEDYSNELYTSEEMDKILIRTIAHHQANYEKVDHEFKWMSETELASITDENEPTRKIQHGGWHTWDFDHEQYFDDGEGKMAPEEFVMLRVIEDDEENKVVDWLHRRYDEAFDKKYTREEMEAKRSVWNEWRLYFKEIEEEGLEHTVTVQDLVDDFGELSHINYDFQWGTLEVNWVALKEDGTALEINATIPMTEENVPTRKDDLYNLRVKSIGSDTLYKNSNILTTDDFIGQ